MSPHPETFAPFDAANYLNTVDDAATYLDAAIEDSDDDPTVIAQALGTIARSQLPSIARDAGMSREGLYKALSADEANARGSLHHCCDDL